MPVGETQAFEYRLDNEFFTNIDGPEIQRGKVDVTLNVKRTTTVWELKFHLSGIIYIPCDRCLDDMEHVIESDEELFVKLGAEYSEETDTLIIIPESEGEINVAWYLYEFMALSIPLKHVHPYGKCNKEMNARLQKMITHQVDEAEEDEENDIPLYVDENTSEAPLEEKPTDPRWDALKKLKR